MAAEFQREVNQGTPHIIIQEHLDLTGLGAAEGATDQNELLQHKLSTLSIRVRSGCVRMMRSQSRWYCFLHVGRVFKNYTDLACFTPCGRH